MDGKKKRQARSTPLAQIREASKSSWRAAAWLVKYLDARADRGRAANVSLGASPDIACPKSAAAGDVPREAGKDGENSERLYPVDPT